MRNCCIVFFTCFLCQILPGETYLESTVDHVFEWAVIGAGAGGIAAIGTLADNDVPLESILWIDPQFDGGRLGQFYENVLANVSNGAFFSIFNSCKTFQMLNVPSLQHLGSLPSQEHTPLKNITVPLKEITQMLMKQVTAIPATVLSLHFYDNIWHITLSNNTTMQAKSVILATGSKPKELPYKVSTTIPLDFALDEEVLQQLVKPNDTILVVGSSHSAILILMYLSRMNVKKVINLYVSPIVYAPEHPYGIKGFAASWAKNVLEKNPPHNLIRIFNSEEHRNKYLPECTKVIYAVGYIPNALPSITIQSETIAPDEVMFDATTGSIGPRLFGIGIAFPDFIEAAGWGRIYQIGLNDFIKYAQRLIPQWLRYNQQRSYQGLWIENTNTIINQQSVDL